jgi:hypothetical protein
MAAYHFSWLWILIPLLLAGPEFPDAYFPLYVAVLTFGFVHRHYTLGYAYLDAEVFAQHRRRFIWVPLFLGAGLLATPFLLRTRIPGGAFSVGEWVWPESELRLIFILTFIIFAAGVWNIWHTMAQKYGILRIYTAKARIEARSQPVPDDRTEGGVVGARGSTAGVPGWVDRLFVMGWLPLIVCYVVPRFSETVAREFKIARFFVDPLLGFLTAGAEILVPVSGAIAAASAVTFAVFEWRAHRFRNRPRLSMALGTFALWACFIVFDPIKVYLAFAFSHGLEYMVFVWAFQRRRYAERRNPQPLMGRILEHPWIAYPLYTLALGGVYVLLHEWEPFDFWSVPGIRVATVTLGQWVFFWGVFQSLLHFYYDGFLWKTRHSAMSRSL